jgi:hypothetical protein
MSWDGDDIREIYRSPVEMGWGHRISFDHDIIGRAALEDALDGKSRDASGGVAIGHSKMGHSTMGHARMADANAPDSSQRVFKSLHLRPGEIGHLAWASEGIRPLIGCHIPGHYEGGMKGMVVYA